MKIRVLALMASSLAAVPALAAGGLTRDSFQAANQPGALGPGPRTASGSKDGMSWTASNRIVAMTSTATIAGGGNPAFLAPRNKYNGVVSLIMTYSTGSFICSGSLMPDRVSIVTAAHCVSDGAGTAGPLLTRAFFSNSPNLDTINHTDPASSVRTVSRIMVNENYTGNVIDQNDIAVLRLESAAPAWALSYDLDFTGGLDGEQFNVAGYGARSDTGGSVGANLGPGRIRQGDNSFDYAWGNSEFGGFFTDLDENGFNFFTPETGPNAGVTAEVSFSYVSDFDSGFAANDMSCLIADAVGASLGFGCNLGVGALEVGVAGGDSGGPQFINGKLVSVTSYGLSFGPTFGDCVAGLQSSCGEYSGYVPVYIHEDFINFAVGVPEPSSWAMLIAGFGLVGATMRRRRTTTVAA